MTMEKTIAEEQTVTRERHFFYCDECGDFLGESEEWPDGYYENIGDYTWKYYDKSCDWLAKRGNYCDKCKEKIAMRIAEALRDLGFTKEH